LDADRIIMTKLAKTTLPNR